MKRAFLALALLVLLAAPASARGGIGFHAGWIDTDEADNDAGWGALFHIGVTQHVDIQVRATDFRELSVKPSGGNGSPSIVIGESFDFQATTWDLGFVYNFFKDGRKLTPYVGGGGTYYMLDSTPDSRGRVGDEYGWYGVAGLDFPIGKQWAVYVEGMWRDAKMTIKGDDFGLDGPVDVGVNLNGPQVNLGLAFTW